MKRIIKYTSIILLIVIAFSCNTKKKEDNSSEAQITQKETINSVDTSGISLQWTAYKFTDKMAVHGTFDDFMLVTQEASPSIEEFLVGAKITINTQSVNSGNEVRDDKLRTYFFDVFHSDTIRGEILSAEKGKGKVTLELNNISKSVDYEFEIHNDTVSVKTAINLVYWEGEQAINTLNQECYELHMGADKVSKLWPNVDIMMKLPIRIDSLSN